MKRLVFAVTNDLSYDQRMIRICNSLSSSGYHVSLVGRKLKDSPTLVQGEFHQRRLRCFFTKGKAFYVEYNLRLSSCFSGRPILFAPLTLTLFFPLFGFKTKRNKAVYDAHELFCEMKEIVSKPSSTKI